MPTVTPALSIPTNTPPPASSPGEFEFTFESDAEGWTVGFADLPVGHDQSIFELADGHRPLPDGLEGSGIYVRGHNRSDEDRARLAGEIDWELRRCGGLSLRESVRQEGRKRFVVPSSLANALAVGSGVGTVLIMILAASVIGAEYGWGTLRTTLTGSPGRWQLLASKLLTLMLLSGVGLVVVALLAAISSFIAASLISANGGGLTDSGAWSTVAVIFGKGVYGLVPYIILALFLSVLTSSSSMGISIGLGYYFVEAILVGILTNVFDWFSNATDFLLGPSVIAWMTEPGVQATGGDAALFPLQDLPSQLHAFLVLTAYIVIIGTVAFWLFQHKDIAGAKGE